MNVSQASCGVERFPREGCSSEDVSNVIGQDRACWAWGAGHPQTGQQAPQAFRGASAEVPFSWEPPHQAAVSWPWPVACAGSPRGTFPLQPHGLGGWCTGVAASQVGPLSSYWSKRGQVMSTPTRHCLHLWVGGGPVSEGDTSRQEQRAGGGARDPGQVPPPGPPAPSPRLSWPTIAPSFRQARVGLGLCALGALGGRPRPQPSGSPPPMSLSLGSFGQSWCLPTTHPPSLCLPAPPALLFWVPLPRAHPHPASASVQGQICSFLFTL